MGRSVKSRQTVIVTHGLADDSMWTQTLPLSFVPDEVIVRSVRYLANIIDPNEMGFVTADFIQHSARQMLCEFSPNWIVSENTTFTDAGVVVDQVELLPICQVNHPNSHFTFNQALGNSTVTFTVVGFNGALLILSGELSIHLEFVQWDTK